MKPRTPPVARRHFLALAASLFAGIAASPALAAFRRARPKPCPICADLGALIGHGESASAVGNAYLRAVPEEADRAVLIAHLAPDHVCATGKPHPPLDALRADLGARIRADFAGADTIRLNGVVLSRTEARIAALTALR